MGCYRTGTRWRWPYGVIPYTINEDDFPDVSPESEERRAIRLAIERWLDNTLIKLRPRDGEPHWVEFVAGDEASACHSRVGMQSGTGAQQIYCDPGKDALTHEIGHAVGLIHEQQRDDRDEHINVHLENVRADKRSNFDHRDDATEVGPYDYHLLMHYAPGDFAVDWRPGKALLGQRSTHGPAMTAAGGELHLAHLGDGSQDIYHSWSSDGETWTEQTIAALRGDTEPAIAEHGGELHIVHLRVGTNDILHSVSMGLRHWVRTNIDTGQTSKVTPAIASFNGELHMVGVDDNSDDLWHSWTADGGATWTQRRIDGQKSWNTPGLAVYNGELHMVHIGRSGTKDLWHTWTVDGRNWIGDMRIEDQSSGAAPDLCEFNGRLHLVHRGDTSATFWHSFFDVNGWQPNNHDDNNESWRSPALAVVNSELHMTFLGKSDHKIYHTVRDTRLVTFDTPGGVTAGSRGILTDGDLAAVRRMYPPPPSQVSPYWLEPVLPVLMAA
jgi:hypothetical protein